MLPESTSRGGTVPEQSVGEVRALPVVPPVRLDAHCLTCADQRCDINHDCGLLKYRRRERVRACVGEVATYLARQHSAVPVRTLVTHLFPETTMIAAESAARYAVADYARLLNDALGRDRRFVRHGDAWALRGTLLAQAVAPERTAQHAAAHSGAESLDAAQVAAACARIRAADRPLSTRELAHAVGGDESHAAAVARALRAGPRDIRPLAIDPRTSAVTRWASAAWLTARLPIEEDDLPPVVIADRHASVAAALATAQVLLDDVGASDDQEDDEEMVMDAQLSREYTVTTDAVLDGSLVLRPTDTGLFPAQPMPAWVELRDEWGGVYDGLLVHAPEQTELFGLRPFFLAHGSAGVRLRFIATDVPSLLWLTVSAVADEDASLASFTSSSEDGSGDASSITATRRPGSVARRLWGHFLAQGPGCTASVAELAEVSGVREHFIRTALRGYRCFVCEEPQQERWGLSTRWPGLRPHLFAHMAGGRRAREDQAQALAGGIDARTTRLLEGVAAMVERVRRLQVEADSIAQEARDLVGEQTEPRKQAAWLST